MNWNGTLSRCFSVVATAAFIFSSADSFAETSQSSTGSQTAYSGGVQDWVPELSESVIAQFRMGDVAKYSPPYQTLSACEEARDRNALDVPWLARTDCFEYRKTFRYYTHSVNSTAAVEAELKFFGIRAGLRPDPQDIRDRIKETRGWNDACVTKKGKKKLDAQLSAAYAKFDADADLDSRLASVTAMLDKKTMERFAENSKYNPVTACSAEYVIARLEAKKGLVAREIARRGPVLTQVQEGASEGEETVPQTQQQMDEATDDIFADLLKSL